MFAITPQRIDLLLRNPLVLFGGLTALLAAPAVLLGVTFPYWRWVLASQFTLSLVVMGLILFINLHLCAGLILMERKVAGFIQDRKGPNRVGFWGILQPIVDGLKLFLKEDIVPANVDKPLFILAPSLALITAMVGFAVIPWAGDVVWPWMPAGSAPLKTQVADINVGFLYMLAIGSLAVYAVVLAGYASNNKYAHFGGLRATAQMLSYEVPLGLGLLALLVTTGTLRLDEIVNQQATSGVWFVFMHPIAFLLVLISAFAETNRTPFDLAEAEQELVAGYHTEYSAMKFGLFYLGEYAHMITNSALLATLFFGGWHLWGVTSAADTSWVGMLLKFAVLWAKIMSFLMFYMIIRWTIPRFRFDQLMRLAWKGLVPLGLALVVATGVLVLRDWQNKLVPTLLTNIAIIAVALVIASRAKRPISGRQENLPPVELVTGSTGGP